MTQHGTMKFSRPITAALIPMLIVVGIPELLWFGLKEGVPELTLAVYEAVRYVFTGKQP